MGRTRTGTWLRIPYDWRRPTWDRFKNRWWNTTEHRLFPPKSYGWGFSLNLAQVARLLHLRR